MSLNGISTATAGDGSDPVANKQLRRQLKLDLAKTKRSTAGTYGYRPLNKLTGTHPAYVTGSTNTVSVSGTASPTVGHPWKS